MQARIPKKIFLIILMFSFITSCGQSTEEKMTGNLISAEIHLSKRECQSAIDLLEGMGRQNKNARYLKLLSSAYACRGGYSTITFFGTDIALSATPAPLGGITRYSTSLIDFDAPLMSDQDYADLQTAIDILLYAGGIATNSEPTSVARAEHFSGNEASDINSQLAYMMFVQLGRFMKVYADTDALGVKGGGIGSNVCFSDYPSVTDNEVEAILAAMPGACKVKTDVGHAQLNSSVDPTVRRQRLCHGVVLLNGVLDLLPSVLVSAGGGDLSVIANVTTQVQAAKTALTNAYPAIGTVLSVLSQENCETDVTINDETIESYYATIFEALVQ